MTPEEPPSALPTFATARLHIRPLERKDAEVMFAIRSDPRVREQYCMEPATLGETRNWLEERVAERDRRVSMYWVFALKDEDRVIGSCCLWNFDRESNRAEIGYELHRDFWKKGFMSEGIPPVLSYGFGDVRLHRIEACPVADNVASTTLLLRLGFKLEGNTRQRVLFRGRYYDQLWYGLLKEEWEAR